MPPSLRARSCTGNPARNDTRNHEPPNTDTKFKELMSQYHNVHRMSNNEYATKAQATTQVSSKGTRKRASPSQDESLPSLSKKRKSNAYAPPSKYAHLKGLTDTIAPGLLVLFVGHNPGVMTAATGHAYAHPSNHFWKLLHASGITDRRCSPTEDGDMPELYSLGLTNIVARPTKDTAELSKEEQVDGTPILEEKIRIFRPEVVCIVGKSIWEAIWKFKHQRGIRKTEFNYGWQDETLNLGVVHDGDNDWPGARVFIATTTSGLAAGMKPAEKEAVWKPLGEWVKQRRRERTEAIATN